MGCDRRIRVTGAKATSVPVERKSLANQFIGFSYTYVYLRCCPCAVKSFS